MSANASDEQKEAYEYFKKFLRNATLGKESGLALPSDTTMDGKPMFDFNVVSLTGAKAYDVNKIIERYQNEIKTTLYATFLSIGQSGGGSFALSDNATKFADEVVLSKLSEIKDVLNHVLIPFIFKANGWETEIYPEFTHGDVSKPTLDELGKFIQRAGAVGWLAKTAKNVNYIGSFGGMPDMIPEDSTLEEVAEYTGSNESKVSEGMKSGMGNGVGEAGKNNSATNSDNAA